MPPHAKSASCLLYSAAIPVENILALAEHDARLLLHVIVDRLEVLDPVRHAADIWMHGDRHDAPRFGALFVQAIELIARAIEQLRGLMMLNQHDRNVVE